MRHYKHSNGRVVMRDSRGRFRNPTFAELFGCEANTDALICGKCGYGEDENWFPLVRTGICPECGNEENHKIKEMK